MRLLALDAASKACSAAFLDGKAVTFLRSESKREHGPILISMVNELLARSGTELPELDALAFGCGPGSFTGVRIAAGITQGLAFGSHRPVVAVSDLAMMAQGCMDEEGANAVAVCCDARMGEAFVGFYQRDEEGLANAVVPDRLLKPAGITLPARDAEWQAVGDGWQVFAGLSERLELDVTEDGARRLPDARYAINLARAGVERGEAVSADRALPVYLRDESAWREDSP